MLSNLFQAQRTLVLNVATLESQYGYYTFHPDTDCFSEHYEYMQGKENPSPTCLLINAPQFQDYLRHLAYCCYEELGEIGEEEDLDKVQEEVIDLLHFIIEIGVYLGRSKFPKVQEEMFAAHIPYQFRVNAFTKSLYLLMRQLKNKRWKPILKSTNIQVLNEALDDFLISGLLLCAESFYDLGDLEKAYMQKLRINHQRLEMRPKSPGENQ